MSVCTYGYSVCTKVHIGSRLAGTKGKYEQ